MKWFILILLSYEQELQDALHDIYDIVKLCQITLTIMRFYDEDSETLSSSIFAQLFLTNIIKYDFKV